MKRNELMKKVYASPVISEEIVAVESGFEEIVAVESGFAASGEEGIGTRSLNEETYSIQWQ